MQSPLVAPIILFSAFMAGVPANPKIRVDLVPDNPGPYAGGEQFNIDVWLHNEVGEDFWITEVRFDFEASNPKEMGPEFTFDFSALEGPNHYITDPNLPRPQTQNHLLCICHLYMPNEGSIPIGTLPVTLPANPGICRIDALNASGTQQGYGAYIEGGGVDFGLGLSASDGDIVGGSLDLRVGPSPIPATSSWGACVLGLLIVVEGILVVRSRSSPCRQHCDCL